MKLNRKMKRKLKFGKHYMKIPGKSGSQGIRKEQDDKP